MPICKCGNEGNQICLANYPEIKGSSIKNSIKWKLEELPFNQPIEYLPKDTSVQRNIIQQLKSSGIMQITGRNEIIELKFDHSRILLTRKSKYVLKADVLQRWLSKFGLQISLVTATHLVEFGMPYAGEIYPMHAMLRFTNNGHGIIGLLAYELALLVKKNSRDPFLINDINHPLSQSVVLALSRVEHYLNPSLV